jgi:hypothetical protein
VVVEIPDDDDDDVPPPGWDQWASTPASAPEASVGGSRGPGWHRRGAGAPGRRRWAFVVARRTRSVPGAGQEGSDASPPHFIDAQAKQGLWEELCDHGASLNRVLNEALRIHSGPAWRVFQVS